MLPEKDRRIMPKSRIVAQVTVMFGGRAAEDVILKDISAGAHDDIKKATDIARQMVCSWGMADATGPINYSDTEEHLFLGREISRQRHHSEHTAEVIDQEVRKIVDRCYENAKQIIRDHREVMERVAQALLKHEVLTGAEIDRLVAGERVEDLRRSEDESSSTSKAPPRGVRRSGSEPSLGSEPLPGPVPSE
jgi:cell division protease FtsH